MMACSLQYAGFSQIQSHMQVLLGNHKGRTVVAQIPPNLSIG